MRFRLLTISLAGLLAVFPKVAISGETRHILWCPESRDVILADCQDTPPENGQPFLAFPLEEGCLGAPLDRERANAELPKCSAIRLIDESSNKPINRECEVVVEKLKPKVSIHTTASGSVIQAPSWADETRIRCPGYADLEISAQETRGEIAVRRGRVVEITVLQDLSDGSDDTPRAVGTVEMRQIDDAFSNKVDVRPGETVGMGSVPLGEYTMKIVVDGAATVVDSFNVIEAPEPLELLYTLAPGHCLIVPVHSSDLADAPSVDFELYALSETKPPVLFEGAALSLDPVGKNRWQGEICEAPDGRYELVFVPRGFLQQSRLVEISDASVTLDAFQLDAGIGSSADVIDEGGLPVAGAQLTVSWRDQGLAQRATAVTNEQGQAELAPLRPDTRFNLYVKKDGYLVASTDGLAGDRLLVSLRREGAFTAKIIGDICDEEVPGIVIEVERAVGAGSIQKSYQPEGCEINIPVSSPGSYRLAISAPDVVRHLEKIQLIEDLSVDLGEIELKRGEILSVEVVHEHLPVPGATVRLSRRGPTKVTDTRGVVEFATLADDSTTVEIIVSHPDFASRRVVESLPDSNELVIEVFKGGEIYGWVLAADGSPSVGETISVMSNWDQQSTTVDGSGKYRFPRLDPGQWRIFRIRNFGDGQAGLVIGTGDSRFAMVGEGESVELNFAPQVYIQGRVFIDGQLSSEKTIGAVQTSGSTGYGPSALYVSVDSLGQYKTYLPLPGSWSFRLGASVFVVEVTSCPCVADLYFSTGNGNSQE